MKSEKNRSNKYAASTDLILNEYILHLKSTFGNNLFYVGTTVDDNSDISRLRDVDTLVIFKKMSLSHINFMWKIINRLHTKYNIILDTRIHGKNQLKNFPLTNKYLLQKFLNDKQGTNPFKSIVIKNDELLNSVKKELYNQEQKFIALSPKVLNEPNQIREAAQIVFDALRAFLIFENNPICNKEDTCDYFRKNYPEFSEVKDIFEAYLNPNSIIDVSGYLTDSIALLKHLNYRTKEYSFSDEVLLINAPSSPLPHPRNEYLSYDHNMPLGLVCLASYLESKNTRTRILDAYAENLGLISIIDEIFKGSSLPKIIGINAASPNIHLVHGLALYIKRINKEIKIVCGGPHASIAIEHTLSTGDIDYTVVGEGEIAFGELVNTILSGNLEQNIKIPGVATKRKGKIQLIKNETHFDLNHIPEMRFDKLPLKRYFNVKKRLYLHITRGCCYNCIYCSVPKVWGKEVREMAIDDFIKQIKKLIAKYHPSELQIVDDNFSHKKCKIISTFCEGLKRENIKIKWKCQVRADQLSLEVIKKMVETGCFEIDLGVESGNVDIQKYIRKGLNLSKVKTVIEEIKKCGIFSKAFFMIGFPDETFLQIQDSINYAITLKSAGLNDVAFFPVMPFPGTEISRITKKQVFQGAIIDEVDIGERTFSANRLRKYSAKPEISLNDRFSPDELRILVKFAYEHFKSNQKIENLEQEFQKFKTDEELNIYGI